MIIQSVKKIRSLPRAHNSLLCLPHFITYTRYLIRIACRSFITAVVTQVILYVRFSSSFMLFKYFSIDAMNLALLVIVCSLPALAQGQSASCSCQLDSAGMTMVCTNVHTLVAYQQCMHEQLNTQSDLRLRRGGVITNLTITEHRMRSVSRGLFQFSYGNTFYQLNDLRYLHVVHGSLRHLENRSLTLIERALEYLDLSNNELDHVPQLSNGNEEYANLMCVPARLTPCARTLACFAF